MPNYLGARNEEELRQILALQRVNLATAVTPQEALEQGFLTVVHELATLRAMNTPHPHTVAKDGEQIVGYALSMLEDHKEMVPMLAPFFERVRQLSWQERPLTDVPFILMGQVCVAKSHRGQGVFTGLYRCMQERMAPHFELIVTEISARNTRSLRAHEKVGFSELDRFTAPDGEVWVVVGLPTYS